MLPEFVNGLPLHPLIVHLVVVLLPLAVLGSVVVGAVFIWWETRAAVPILPLALFRRSRFSAR